jgi:dihydropteroate synthase
VDEELARVIPIIEALAKVITVPLSIDTCKSEVAREALSSGASMVNDVWALSRDPLMSEIISESGVPIVLMHNQDKALYEDLISDVIDRLYTSMDCAISKGVKKEQILLDPGVGFGKNTEDNLEILRRLDEFDVLGRPLLIGTSRKSTIGNVLGLPLNDRVEGTAATVALAIAGGVDIVRVHDVKQMVRVSRMSDAITRGWISN